MTFAADYRDYVAALGVASYEGHELTGVCPFPRDEPEHRSRIHHGAPGMEEGKKYLTETLKSL